jgi:RHS repeat-associated protein
VTSRTETGLTSNWTYGTSAAAKNVGKLTLATTSAGYTRALTYDSLGRPASTQLTIGGANYTYSSAYDTNGRLSTVTYPSSFQAQYVYTALGYLSQLKDAVGGFVFWTAGAMNAAGQLTQETAGNGVATNRAFDPLTGRLTGVTAGASNSVANLGFAYDALGNLAGRSDPLSFGTESFTYDALNRLLTAQVSGQTSHGVSYNAVGNILTKTRLDNNALANTYSYNAPGQARPHAVASVAGLVNGVLNPVYTYDLNGNLTSGAGRTVTWTAFNMVATIVQGATNMSYTYDSEHSRITQTEINGASTTTTTYLNDPASGLSSEKVVSGATTTWTDYIFAGGARIGQRTIVNGVAAPIKYYITDHLGSIAVITDGGGAVLERLAYDAWGKRRNTNGTDDPAGAVTSATTRGFTGHEHIASVGLVNMNGRVYDPELGRFLSADPVIDSIFVSQVLNRYSYVGNNPLSLTDPSGYSWLSSLFRSIPILRAIVQIAVAITLKIFILPALAPVVLAENTFANAFLSGAISGGVAGGNLKAAAIGGFSAGAFYGVGEAFGPGTLGNIAGHALVGGLVSEAQGGKFGAGFLAAGFGAFAGPYVSGFGEVGGTIASAIIGGVGSVLGGGKFANGAVTAAFGYLFNYEAHRCGSACAREVNKLTAAVRTVLETGALPSGLSKGESRLVMDAASRITMSHALGVTSNLYPGIAAAIFISLTRDRGAWDYKNHPNLYPGVDRLVLAAFGNVAFGAEALAFIKGNAYSLVTPDILEEQAILRLSGAYQVLKGGSQPGWGSPFDFGQSSYGDDPDDQYWLRVGMNMYKGVLGSK